MEAPGRASVRTAGAWIGLKRFGLSLLMKPVERYLRDKGEQCLHVVGPRQGRHPRRRHPFLFRPLQQSGYHLQSQS